MASDICIPRLGWNMEEGVFLGWLRQSGETVRAGESLFTLEGEKSAQEVEAAEDGVLWIDPDGPDPGAVVPVGLAIGAVLRAGEAPPSGGAPRGAMGIGVEVALSAGVESATSPSPGGLGVIRETPAQRAQTGVSRARPQPPGVSETPAPGVTDATSVRHRSSPLARRAAKELGIDWTTLRGTGTSGRVRKADVLAAAQSRGAEASPSRSIPIRPMRRTIAARMVESRTVTAPVTLTTRIDATNLVNLRGQFRTARADAVPSYSDLVVRLVALALRDHPLLNARWEGDHIVAEVDASIGLAVDTDAGLLVPVIRGADRLGLLEIAERSRDLIARARAGSLKAEEMRGGTFTITNLGAFGIDAFTPIINLPECAILGLGRIAREPVFIGDRVEGRDRMTLSLTFDHRIVDGAPAARFLQDVGRRIENPAAWLVS